MDVTYLLSVILCVTAIVCSIEASVEQCSRLEDKDIRGGRQTIKSGHRADQCCALCRQSSSCKGYAWNSWARGTCYLKTDVGQIVDAVGVISGVLQGQNVEQCSWLQDKDIHSGAQKIKRGYQAHQCCALCNQDCSCKGFAWNSWQGGTCYLKTDVSRIVNAPGVISGVINGGNVTTTTPKPPRPGKLIFDEQFNSFNLDLWKHEVNNNGGGNGEMQYYANNRNVSYVRDGVLYIKAGLTKDILGSEDAAPSKIMSARMVTSGSFSFKYGKMEVRAKLPKGDWLWPAIWMIPQDSAYGPWPRSGEIDIMESRGNVNYPPQNGGGVESFGSALHFGPAWNQDHYWKAHQTYALPSGTFNDAFHTFGLVWTADRMYTYIDNDANRVLDLPIEQDFWTFGEFGSGDNPWINGNRNAPFDKKFFIILNVAVGGGYFAPGVGGKTWRTGDRVAFYDARDKW